MAIEEEPNVGPVPTEEPVQQENEEDVGPRVAHFAIFEKLIFAITS